MKPKRPMPATDELRERFGANLRAHRQRVGISQWDLAWLAEIHVTGVGPFELGQKVPRLDTFIRLAGSLKVTPNELVAGILWTPPEVEVVHGSFEVPEDPELAEAVAALREDPRGRPKEAKR